MLCDRLQPLQGGGCKARRSHLPGGRGVRKPDSSRMVLESPGRAGETPVGERAGLRLVTLSTTGHANPVGSRGVHLPRLNTFDDR